MFWHIDTDIVSLIVTCSLYIYAVRLLPKDKLSAQNKGLFWCLRAGIVMTVIDIAASAAMEAPVPRFWYHVLMTAYFIVIILTIL